MGRHAFTGTCCQDGERQTMVVQELMESVRQTEAANKQHLEQLREQNLSYVQQNRKLSELVAYGVTWCRLCALIALVGTAHCKIDSLT